MILQKKSWTESKKSWTNEDNIYPLWELATTFTEYFLPPCIYPNLITCLLQ